MKIEISKLTFDKLKAIIEDEFEGYDFDMIIQHLLSCYDQSKKNTELYKKMKRETENLMKLAMGN